ncbi:N-acetyltransferase family protein [Poriferisphaera sp. WC338]|uniref:GNAT family N-acetyltransferase n=1 Tax=Poriferisphaera sp. WC338 TaxID=3425129 RepID=UPI003D81B50F
MDIREAVTDDFAGVWSIFSAVVSKGDTYAYPKDMTADEARVIWMEKTRCTYVVVDEGEIVGTYYLKTNYDGPGDHVCNCGYMVADDARGKGLATMMCEHSQKVAVALGYKAMQFNFVATSNAGAVRLWERLGFEVVGRLPWAFKHPNEGYVDALVMYKWLGDSD